MATYRIYYAELQPKDGSGQSVNALARAGHSTEHYTRTEWEDEVEASDPIGALDIFFREHAGGARDLAWVDDDGEAHPVTGLDYDPEQTYIWIEDEKLMEYQGFDEATPGMVTCPLCNGHGEVDEELATEFDEVWGEDGDEDSIHADIQG